MSSSAPTTIQVHELNFREIITSTEIATRVAAIAQQMDSDFKGKQPLMIAILNGAFMFATDLAKACEEDFEITFIRVSSYKGTASTGKLEMVLPIKESVAGRPIIIIEDIVDTGTTLFHLKAHLLEQGASSVSIAAMLFKPDNLQHPLSVEYTGFEIPPAFVVGYGLDYNGLGRTWPSIYSLVSEAEVSK